MDDLLQYWLVGVLELDCLQNIARDQASASNQVSILQSTNIAWNHPLDTIIDDISRGVQTRSRLDSFCEHFLFVSTVEPKNIDEALKDVDWVNAMHEELNNFTRN